MILIAGPCVLENREMALRHAERLKKITESLPVRFFFKSSFDKSNRQSYLSFRGVGLERGLSILDEIRSEFALEICTDIHEIAQIKPVAEVASVIQIPALLSRQTDLLVNAGLSGKIIEVKRGQFSSPYQMAGPIEKIRATGNTNIWLTERGYAFGYNDLIFDPRSIPIMKSFCNTVLFDVSHSQQRPGSIGLGTGGQLAFAEPLARAAIALGVSGLFCETHVNPKDALSDASTQYPLDNFASLLHRLLNLKSAIGDF